MLIDIVIVFIKAFVFLNAVLILTSLLTWMERKQSAVMQDRIGANRAPIFGIRAFGLPHIIADALKMFFNTLDINEIIRHQGSLLWGWLPKWGVVVQPLGFLLFFIAGIAETKRVPFDLPEGESEIIGYFVEYSSMKFGAFFMVDFVETVLIAALTATLFFGGWQVPYLAADGFHFPWGTFWSVPAFLVTLLQVAALGLKVVFFCWFMLLIRWTLPRFRYDQLMRLGWKMLLPLSILNIFVTALIIIYRSS